MPDIAFEGFDAIRDHMSKTFRVYGTVLIPNGGFRVRVEMVMPQGSNPDDLLLKLVFQPDFENTPPEQLVEFSEDWSGEEPPTYSTATFRIEGPGMLGELEPPASVSVQDVH